MTKKVNRYKEKFKADAVKEIENNGGNISAIAKQLRLLMQKTLANWQRKASQGKLKSTKKYDPEPVSALEEIKRLKNEN